MKSSNHWKTSANRGPGDRIRRGSVKKRRRAREETRHRCPKKEMDATPSGNTILGVEYDNYSPRYSLSVPATKVNIFMGDRGDPPYVSSASTLVYLGMLSQVCPPYELIPP